MNRRACALSAVLILASLAGAADTLVVPDPSAVPPDDEKAIRKMLDDYLKAIAAGDRAAAVKMCDFKNKDQEKICKLACEVDFVIARLRETVEKKLGKDAWGDLGSRIGEMSPKAMKEATLSALETPDEVTLTWNAKDVEDEHSLAPYSVTIRNTKEGWKFAFDDAVVGMIIFRRELRDEIAELGEIIDDVASGKIKDAAGVKAALAKYVKEIREGAIGDVPHEGVPIPGVMPMPGVMPDVMPVPLQDLLVVPENVGG